MILELNSDSDNDKRIGQKSIFTVLGEYFLNITIQKKTSIIGKIKIFLSKPDRNERISIWNLIKIT